MIQPNFRIFHAQWLSFFLLLCTMMPIHGYAVEFPRTLNNSAYKSNYLRNGGFQQRYEFWARSIGDISKGSSQAEIIPFPHGEAGEKAGKALHVRHTGQGYIQFAQVVSVPGPDLIFTASFQADSREGMMRAFSGSGVAQIGLQYQDECHRKLGETILVNYVKNPFADTPLLGVPRRAPDTYTTHYIEFAGGELNQNYKIDVRQEIENNLMGINPEAVKYVAVIIWCGASHAQAGTELWVTDLSLTNSVR